ncbi:GNAT family N-acetyltransferase [Loktanella salsilacus]|uniref:GNAT family N-acetyltransferase n=1 Tax=Loktanella salsilacus TaxID=195913 RepID=UPI003736DEE3
MLMRPATDLTNHPLPLQQSPGFARALKLLGRDAVIEPLQGCGQVLVLRRALGGLGCVRFASRGPVFLPEFSIDDRASALRSARLHLVNAGPGDAAVMRRAGFFQILSPATTAILQLDLDPGAQLARAFGKWRNAARQGMAANLRLRQRLLCPSRDGWLLDADLAQQRTKRFRALPHALSLAFAQANPGDALILTASEGGTPVAAMLFLRHGAMATYQIGWSGPRGRALRAHHAMLLDAACRFAAMGVSHLDLGTVDTQYAPGLARFKLGSGAAAQVLGGTWARLPGWRG